MVTEPKGHMGTLEEARVILRQDSPLSWDVNRPSPQVTLSVQLKVNRLRGKQIHDYQLDLKGECFFFHNYFLDKL